MKVVVVAVEWESEEDEDQRTERKHTYNLKDFLHLHHIHYLSWRILHFDTTPSPYNW